MSVHGQDVPQAEKRVDHFISEIILFCDGMLTMHEPVKSNLPAENK